MTRKQMRASDGIGVDNTGIRIIRESPLALSIADSISVLETRPESIIKSFSFCSSMYTIKLYHLDHFLL